MSGFKLITSEVMSILRNPKVLIPVIAVLFIPVLYSAMFLWAFYNPYGKLDQLPVAVVNQDEGAIQDDRRLTIGDDLVEKLKENRQFEWHFVDRQTALKGLNENRYYMMIEIPKDFSQKATTVLDEHPQKLELIYMPNESLNFLASQIGETASLKIREQLADTITATYAETIFEKIASFPEGLNEASEGAHQLAVGSEKAHSGIITLQDHLKELAKSTLTFKNGISELTSGAKELNNGLTRLQQGAHNISDGLTQLQKGHVQLVNGAEQTDAGIKQLTGGLKEELAGLNQTKQGSEALVAGLQQFIHAHPDLTNDPALQVLIEKSNELSSGMRALTDSHSKLVAGAEQLSAGQEEFISGMNTFSDKMKEAQQGAVALSEGSKDLLNGGKRLLAGLTSLESGSVRLASGADQLYEGTQELGNGMIKLTDGADELSTKLKEAANLAHIQSNDASVDMFADPVELKVEKLHKVPNYGTGFAPYFLSLGLYVGALILSIVVSLRTPAIRPESSFSWFMSKFVILAVVGITQAIIAATVIRYVLKIEVESLPLFYLFSMITSLTFVALIQFLVTALDNPGRFIAIILLILQLTTSAGTFPLEVIPNLLQYFNPWLPMTYSVSGFKTVISSGDFRLMWQNAGMLAIFILIAVTATYLYFVRSFRREYQTK